MLFSCSNSYELTKKGGATELLLLALSSALYVCSSLSNSTLREPFGRCSLPALCQRPARAWFPTQTSTAAGV